MLSKCGSQKCAQIGRDVHWHLKVVNGRGISANFGGRFRQNTRVLKIRTKYVKNIFKIMLKSHKNTRYLFKGKAEHMLEEERILSVDVFFQQRNLSARRFFFKDSNGLEFYDLLVSKKRDELKS
jgi:hypothetical protein